MARAKLARKPSRSREAEAAAARGCDHVVPRAGCRWRGCRGRPRPPASPEAPRRRSARALPSWRRPCGSRPLPPLSRADSRKAGGHLQMVCRRRDHVEDHLSRPATAGPEVAQRLAVVDALAVPGVTTRRPRAQGRPAAESGNTPRHRRAGARRSGSSASRQARVHVLVSRPACRARTTPLFAISWPMMLRAMSADREAQADVAGHGTARVEAGEVDADQFAR